MRNHLVNLTEWRRSNPSATSPRGRGGWLYDVYLANGEVEECRCFPGTYAESRKAAVAYARTVNARELVLKP